MIQCHLKEIGRYTALIPKMEQLIEFLHLNKMNELPLGRTDIDGDNLFVTRVKTEKKRPEELVLEAHHHYIDVHITLQGLDQIGWVPMAELGSPSHLFAESDEITLPVRRFSAIAMVQPEECLIVFPEDAHLPLFGNGTVDKLIAKIRID